MKLLLCCALSTGIYLANTLAIAQAAPGVRVEAAFPQLRFRRPIYFTHAPDGTNRLFVVEQSGRVHRFKNNPGARSTHLVLDISAWVGRRGEEEGLLGLAFHPEFETNQYVYLHYTAARGTRRNVLARFVMGRAGVIDPRSKQVVLEVAQPWSNHNGGMIAFGPDGYLYISLGDGGAGGDPRGHGQSRARLLGSILRIDVDHVRDGLTYAIPPDNPFVGVADTRGEIWAYGLRNVWRFSFDRLRGDLWAGDVGQDTWEEINLIKKGRNYGWNVREGRHPFGRLDRAGPFEEPIIEHGRDEAKSITGGYVYRGGQIPALRGHYVYGDFVTGLIWALRYDGERVTEHHCLGRVPAITSFGEDREGELYITSLNGQLYRLVPDEP